MRPIRRQGRRRRGYTVMLVLVFLILLLSLLGLTYRQAATVLRLEAARSKQILRDEGSLQATARAMAMLQNGPPPTDPFVVTLGVVTSAGGRSYQVTITSEPDAGTGRWKVTVVPAP
jgi:hypothetical protein